MSSEITRSIASYSDVVTQMEPILGIVSKGLSLGIAAAQARKSPAQLYKEAALFNGAVNIASQHSDSVATWLRERMDTNNFATETRIDYKRNGTTVESLTVTTYARCW